MIIPVLALIAAGAPPADYSIDANWLCRPDRADVCRPDATRTVVDPDGAIRIEQVVAKTAPKADCFYVYPTASNDATPNSDMVPGKEELGQAASQFGVFASVCRTFAPMYRQVTLTALRSAMAASAPGASSLTRIEADREIGYSDVRAAWRHYLDHDNHGRPFVLIGHSQGSKMLQRLLAEEIDGKPIAKQLVSAIIPGTAVSVPVGKDVGGDFKSLPLCRADGQIGCIVTFASYRDSLPPPANALFGRSARAGYEAGCTNPARLAGAEAPLDAPLDAIVGFPWWVTGVVQYKQPATGWSAAGQPLPTRFARVPGMLSGRCVTANGFSYLAVHVGSSSFGGLTQAVTSQAVVGDAVYPEWGWHVMDIPIVQGDLVRMVGRQIAAMQAPKD